MKQDLVKMMHFGMQQEVTNYRVWELEQKEPIPYWKWERAVLMFRMYLRVHH